jgi:hypothetical protein
MPVQTRVLIISVAAVLLFGAALVAYRQTIPHGNAATTAALEGLKVHLIRCELGAKESVAVIKVHLRLRNDGTAPVRIGPGSFWVLDAEGLPHLDGYAAEKPDAPPLKLAPGQEGPEMELKFSLVPNLLSRSLVLLVGESPAGKVAGSPPPSQGIRVPLKEDGAPKGPFVEGEWKSFVGTRWR